MTVTVLQLSDCHFGPAADAFVSGYHPEARLAAVLSAWSELNESADLVVLSGDNTDEGTPEAYVRLRNAVDVLEDVPVLAIAGNHDLMGNVGDAFGEAAIAELGEWRIIGLNSSRPNQIHGTIDVGETCELLDALDDRPTALVIHHPPKSPSTNAWFQLDGATELLSAAAERPHVKAILSGHLHQAFEFEGPGGLALLGCPSTLMAIGHDHEQYTIGVDAPAGARIVYLHDDGTVSSTVLVA